MRGIEGRMPIGGNANMVEYLPPDFVIVGTPLPDGRVRIVASKDLSEAELKYEARMQDVYSGSQFGGYDSLDPVTSVTTRTVWTMSTVMLKFTMIDAPDYGTALRHLMDMWKGSYTADRRPIGEGQREVEAGQ